MEQGKRWLTHGLLGVAILVLLFLVSRIPIAPQEASRSPAAPPSGQPGGALDANQRGLVFLAIWEDLQSAQRRFSHPDWQGAQERYLNAILSTRDDAQFHALLREAVAEVNDLHTRPVMPDERLMKPPLELAAEGERILIRQVEPGSPAEAAGLKPGMLLTEIDGQPVAERWAAEARRTSSSHEYHRRWASARSLLLGPAGSRVQVQAVGEDGERIVVDLERSLPEIAPAPAFSRRLLEGGIAYIQIPTFADRGLIDQAVVALRQIAREQPPGLIIDLRGNPGGLHMLGVELADFLGVEPMVYGYLHDYVAGLEPIRTDPAPQTYTGPVLALVDPGCASACDLFAAFLQRSGRAELVGEPPAGGAHMVRLLGQPNGYRLYLSIGQDLWGPDHKPIEGHPAEVAHLVVPGPADWAAGRDAQLEEAVRLLQKR